MRRTKKRPVSLIGHLISGIRFTALVLIMDHPSGRPDAMFRQPMRGYPVVDMMALQYGSDLVGVAFIRHLQRQVRMHLRELAR